MKIKIPSISCRSSWKLVSLWLWEWLWIWTLHNYAVWHQIYRSVLIQVMAYHLYGAKPLLGLTLTLLSIGLLEINISVIWIKIWNLMHLNMFSAKYQPFCSGLNALIVMYHHQIFPRHWWLIYEYFIRNSVPLWKGYICIFNSLDPGGCGSNFTSVYFSFYKLIPCTLSVKFILAVDECHIILFMLC